MKLIEVPSAEDYCRECGRYHRGDFHPFLVIDFRTSPERTAALHMDWGQVVMNGGPPCFHIGEDGSFCGRAAAWDGHDGHHAFISLANLLGNV